MAIQYVGGRTQAIAGANSGTVNVALTGLSGGIASQPAAGDLVLIGYSSGKTADQVIAISGYAEIAELYADGTGADANLEAAYKFMAAAPDTVAAIPNSGSTADAVAVSVRAYRGVDPANPFDVARVTAAGTGTTNPNPAAITPATAGAALVAFGAGAIAGTGLAFASADLTGFHSLNSPDNNDATIGAGHKLDAAASAFDAAAWTGGVSGTGNSWSAIVIALRPLQAVTHQGAMAGSAAGTFAAAGRRQLAGALAAHGAGNFAGAAARRLAGALASSGAGSFAAGASRRAAGALAAAAAASAALLGRQLARGRTAVSAAGNLAARGARSTAAALAAAGSGAMALIGHQRNAGAMMAQAQSDFGASGSVASGSRPAPPSRIGIHIGLGL
jgi:hypothetical protein